MYRIVIGDDDAPFLKEITERMEQIMSGDALTRGQEYEIVPFADPSALYQKLAAKPDYCQLLLLDVEFAEKNGIKIAERLRELGVDCGLIYITCHRDYVYDCFGTRPLWYLVKPVDWDKLAEIVR